ncbi:putative ribonuclease H-like domain-containing protein [Tanacetum coccineum]
MNYVPVATSTITNESAGTQGNLNAGTSIGKEGTSQDYIVMPIWKDASYFDSFFKDVGNDEPKSAADDIRQVEDGPHNESDDKDKSEDDINNASSYDQHSLKDMFKVRASHTLEASHVEFFSDEDEPEVNLGNIPNSYTIEPTSIAKALSDSSWVEAMQEELLQFKLQQVWILMELPNRKRAIGTKWVFRNKKDERGIEIRNKERLVAQGHRQEEGMYYEEVFALVARIKAIRLFLAYASFMGFLVYQMDVKSAFLYGTIEEEVYVTQPPGFKDPDHPDKVYKVVKALYGLHQAPRAWYETLANYLLGNGFQRGKIDQTLFIKKQKGDILLVQVYVDDIIFGSTNKELCTAFEKLMKDKFQMSSMGELTFFLGLQVKQKEDGIFISQDKYVAEILKKFNYTDVKSASTLVDLEKPLVKDGDADDVDVHLYRSMIGSLMYLTTSRPDIIYLKGKPTLGLWYSRDSPFELVAYTDSDYAGATQDRKSTTRDFLQKVSDEAVHKESSDRMEMDATTASSLEVEQKSEEEEPTELVEDFGSGEKGEKEVIIAEAALNTASASISTVSPLRVSTGEDISGVETLVYIRRSASKDKGKAIMQESEPPNKIKKRVQVQISVDEELAKKVFEEEQVVFNAEQEAKYHAVQNRSFSKAEVRKNMCIYLKNQGGYKMSHFKGMSYEDIRPIFERVWDYNQSFVPMESDSLVPKKAAGSSKRNAEEELIQDSSKKQKIGESSVPVEESDDKEPVKLSQEELQKLMIIVPEEGMHVEALLDLIKLWSLVQERFNSPGLTEDKEKELWAEMKMLFEPDEKDLLELQKYMHDPLKWRLYDTCVVHHVSIERGQDIFMLVEKDYPLTRGLLMWMFG